MTNISNQIAALSKSVHELDSANKAAEQKAAAACEKALTLEQENARLKKKLNGTSSKMTHPHTLIKAAGLAGLIATCLYLYYRKNKQISPPPSLKKLPKANRK